MASSSSRPAAFDAFMEQQFNTDDWKLQRSKLRTYNCVFLPPHQQIKSTKEAEAWVEAVFADLSKRYDELNGGSLVDHATQPGHFTIVLNTEFGFNGAYVDNAGWKFNASFPIAPELEAALQRCIQLQLGRYQATHNILFVLSCCTVDNANIGRNRLTILSTKSLDTPIIVPKKFPDRTDSWPGDATVDKVPYTSTAAAEPSEPALHVRNAGTQPSSIILPNLTIQNYAIRAGMGTCLDAKNETYPDVNLAIFLGGGVGELTIKDKHIGHVFNDTMYWRNTSDDETSLDLEMRAIDLDSRNAEPGIRYWQKQQPSFIDVFPAIRAGDQIRGPLYGAGPDTRLRGDTFNIGLSPTVSLPDSRLYMAPPRSAANADQPILATPAQENDFYAQLQDFERNKFWNIIEEKMVQDSSPWTVAKVTDAYARSQTNLPTKCVFGEYLLSKRSSSGLLSKFWYCTLL